MSAPGCSADREAQRCPGPCLCQCHLARVRRRNPRRL